MSEQQQGTGIAEITDIVKSLEVSEPVTTVSKIEASQAPESALYKTPTWSVKDLLGQLRSYEHVVWETNKMDPIWHLRISSDWLLGQVGSVMSKLFVFWKIRPHFTIEVTSPWQHVGASYLVYLPYGERYENVLTGNANWLPGYEFIVQVPHQIITAGHSGTYNISAEWLHPEPAVNRDFAGKLSLYSNAKTYMDFGRILWRPIAPIRVAPGVETQTHARIWVRFEIDTGVYIPDGEILG